jgi:purine-cytosine permease-like protein
MGFIVVFGYKVMHKMQEVMILTIPIALLIRYIS